MKVDGWWVTILGLGALAVGVFVYQNYGSDGWDEGVVDVRPELVRHCGTLTDPDPGVRLDACLAELPVPRLSSGARDAIATIQGRGAVLSAGPTLSVDGEIPLASHPALREILMGTDEEAAAKALVEAGIRGVVVHRDLAGALDRDKRVLSRVVQHDHLERFQLRYVSGELLIYTVRNSNNRVPLATGQRMLAGLRARLEGQPVIPRQSWAPASIRLIGTMRLRGQTLALRHAAGDDIEATLNELAGKLKRRWDREVAIYGHGTLRERIDDIRLEVHVVMERAPVEPRSRYAIFDLWELGIDGMMFRQKEGTEDEKFTYMPGSEAVTRSINSPDRFLRVAAEEGGWRDTRPWEKDSSTRLDIIRTAHFMEAEPGGGRAVRLFRGMPEVQMDDLTDDAIRQMLVDGGEWWLANQRPDGSFLYKYWPAQNRASTEYNEVRHILAARDLSDTWRYKHDDRYLVGAVKSMDWLAAYEVKNTDTEHAKLPHPPPGSSLFRYPLNATPPNKVPNQKLGTVAVALLGWVAWAEASGEHSEDVRIRSLANYVLSQKESSGKFQPYNVPLGHPYYGQVNDIVPGEAALALGEVADYFGEDHWLGFYDSFYSYYHPWFQARAAKKQAFGRWPHGTYSNEDRLELVQFGPWSVMAAKQYYLLTGDERAAEFGLEVADWMIDNYQWRTENSPWPDYVGGYYKLPTELPAMQTFCYAEGTAAAYHIAAKLDPERAHKYERSTREAIRFLEVMQFDDTDAYFASEPDLIHGGIKYAMNENKIRIDYVGHGLSTVSQFLDARDFDPAVELKLTPWELLDAATPERAPIEVEADEAGGDDEGEESAD